MTRINKLTQNTGLNDIDLFVIWDSTNERTRSIRAESIRDYFQGDTVIDVEIINGELIITKEDGTVINLGSLPITSEAQENEVLSFDAATGTLVGTGVFAKDGEMTVSTSTLNLGGAYSIASGGESVCVTNIPKGENFRVVAHDFTEIGNPKMIVNRLSTGEIIPTPIDTDDIVNPDFQYVTPPFLDPAEDGQTVTYADLKFSEGSAITNIRVKVFINDVLFVENFFPEPPEVEAGIRRITYDNPIDIDVGDTFRAIITSDDGDVILKGDADTGVIWQRVTLICWDYKLTGLHEQDVKTLETEYESSVLTTKITLEDGEELSSSVGITVAGGGVNVDGVETSNIFTGSGLESSGDDTGVIIGLTGTEEIVEYNVDDDSTVNLSKSSVGKLVSITQTSDTSIPMLFYIDDHSLFQTGDKIHIVASRPAYKNYYFGVYFYSSEGAADVRYPNDNITLVRTDTNWDVIQQDGPLTRTAIRPRDELHLPFAEDGDYVRPVRGFVFSEHPAINYQDDDQGNTVISFDFYDITPEDPIFKTVAIDTFSSGNPNFTSLIHQDAELHTLIDATRDFRVNIKNIGDGTLTPVLGIDETQAQFLVQPFYGNDKLLTEIDGGNYVEKYSKAEFDNVSLAYQGKYGDDRDFYPALVKQDSNGWVQEEFTGTKVIRHKNKDTGVVGDKILELSSSKVTHKKQPYFNDDKLALEKDIPQLPEDLEMRFGVNEFYDNGPTSTYIQDKPIQFLEMECNGGYINEITHQNYGYTTYVRVYAGNNTSKGVEVKDSTGRVSGRKTLRVGELWRVTSAQKDTVADVFWERVDDGTAASDVYEGQFSSLSVAYNGLYGDDNRLYYPAMVKQDINGWTQEEFTGTKVIRHKDKDTGVVGDKVLELSSTRIDINKQPYYGAYKLQTRTNNPVYRTVSKNDLIGDDDKSLTEWISENPDYTPIEFVGRLFSSKVMGYTNWEASITLSNETFNGTLPYGYTQFRVFRTGGSSRSFMYLHNKESHTVLYAPYKSGVAPVFRKTAYTDEIEEVVTDTLNDLISPPAPEELTAQYVFEDSKLEKGYKNSHTPINPFSYDDTHNRIAYEYRNESSNSARNLFQVLTIKDTSIGYMMVKEDRLKNALANSGLYVPPNLKSEYGVRIQSGTIIRLGGTGSPPINPTNGGKYDYRGLAIPNTNPNTGAMIDPNRQSNGFFLDNDANIVTDMAQANSHFRTERTLGQSPLGNAGEDMNFSLKRGVIIFSKEGDKSDAFFIEDGNSPWYIMVVDLNTTASVTEQYTSVIYKSGPDKAIANINLYPNPLAAALDGEALVLENQFKSKSGYSKLSSGGGSTHRIEFWENGTIFKLSNSNIEVRLLEGMHDEDGKRHGYVKYINSKGADVNFKWYDRNGNQISNSSVPSVCPADTVVEIFANYSTDDYAINFSQSKVIQSTNEEDELMEGLASGVIYAKTVTIG